MRFIYKILIGLLIFNSMLCLLGVFFTVDNQLPSSGVNAKNITGDATISGESYGDVFNLGNLFSFDKAGGILFGLSLSVGVFAAWIIKSPIPIGAGLFSGFILLLYTNTAGVLNTLTPSGNWVITGLITLIGIIIAILAGFTIIDMFSGQQEAT